MGLQKCATDMRLNANVTDSGAKTTLGTSEATVPEERYFSLAIREEMAFEIHTF